MTRGWNYGFPAWLLTSTCCACCDRFLRSGISIDSSEARSLRSFSLTTPFAAPQLQTVASREIPPHLLRDLLPGAVSAAFPSGENVAQWSSCLDCNVC